MSKQLVSRNPDLQRLRDEGYDIEVRSNYLLVRKVPYVTAEMVVAYGTLVSELSLSGNSTTRPGTHVVSFVGAIPCDNHGRELVDLINQRGPLPLGNDLVASCTFSHKPPSDYLDYHEKMSTYVDMLQAYAQAIDPGVTAKTFPPIPADDEESVFRYLDTASSRAQISAVSEKLALPKVAIVGLGGTGSYILDLIAKMPIREIHLYDRDVMYTHNAFRAPGAASLADLEAAPKKVDYYQQRYEPMRRNIIAHPVHIDASNVEELRDMAFVFLAIDGGSAKKLIIEKLEQFGVPFIDTGMGVYQADLSLGGIVRTTASAPDNRRHVWDKERISFADEDEDEYDRNIQLADMNALNAVMAVIKWKKMFGFYTDLEHEYSSTYTIDGNHLLNEDQAE